MISAEDTRIDAAGVLLHEKECRLNQSSEDGIDAVLLNSGEFKQIKDAFFSLASRVKAISAKKAIGVSPPDAIAALKLIESETAMMIREWDGIRHSPGLIYRINDLKNAAKKGLLALSEPIASPMDDETPTKIESGEPGFGVAINNMAQGEPYNPQDSPPDRHGNIPRESSEPMVVGPQEYMTPESIRKAMDEDEDEPNTFAEGCVKNIIDKMDSAVMITFREGRIFTAIGNGFMASLPPGAQVSIRTHDVEVHYDPPAGEF